MADGQLPSIELLRQLLRYEADTGDLYWLERPESMFVGGAYPASRLAASWNSKCAGKEAFAYVNSAGYRTGAIGNVLYLAHRVIWVLVYGYWPDRIDHRDGHKVNNRLDNLRDVSQSVNLRNANGKSNNTSGVTGVNWRPSRAKWRARIMVDYKEKTLGHFDRLDDAIAAREAAAKQMGFTARHGKF